MKPLAISYWNAEKLRALAVCALCLGLASCGGGDEDLNNAVESVEVKEGPLRISVLEGGDLESAAPTIIRSGVEGRNAITLLAPEGSTVTEGDLLVSLDSSGIEQNLLRQETTLENARSDLVNAEEAAEIQQKTNSERLIQARTNLELARNALQAYTEGKLQLELRELQSQITLRKAELTQAKQVLAASKKLREQDFIPQTELDRDELSAQKASQDVEVAQGRYDQLVKWDSKDEVRRLEADIAVKEIAFERVQKQNNSELKQKQDRVKSRRRNYDNEKKQIEKYKEQLEACEIRATSKGLVVYAKRGGRRGNDQPVQVGTEVREREEILRIPDLSDMIVEVDIHETSVKKVQRGQRAWITVDALPGQTFLGTVVTVGLVPSSQSSWMNPDLKVYTTRVKLDQTVAGMKPGMHAQVEILAAEIPDARQIPLQAVHESGSRTFAYVDDGTPTGELREIEVGANNDTMVEVTRGLELGDRVFLSVPDGAKALPLPEKKAFKRGDPNAAKAGSSGGTRAQGGGPGGPGGGPVDDGNLPTERRSDRSAGNSSESTPGGEGRSRGGGRGMSEEMRKRFEAMSPEEKREAMRKFGERKRGGGGRPGRGAEGGD